MSVLDRIERIVEILVPDSEAMRSIADARVNSIRRGVGRATLEQTTSCSPCLDQDVLIKAQLMEQGE